MSRLPDFQDRFDVDSETGCWNWNGTIYADGYGFHGPIRAHRHSYETHGGELLDGMHIDHLCRNRACVNPEHLEQVTPRENYLRGVGASAVNAKKTHCPQGHEYSPENTRIVKAATRPHRMCAECNRAKQREIYRRNKEAGTLPPSVRRKLKA